MVGAILAAVAASADGLAVGSAYGMRGICIPFGSLALIGLVSSALAAAAMSLGRRLALLSPPLAARAGGAVLLALGVAWILQAWRRQRLGWGRDAARSGAAASAAGTRASTGLAGGPAAPTARPLEGPVLLLRLRSLGLVVQVWRDPGAADFDRSGRLEGLEALVLGLSLALDGTAVAMAASLSGWGFLFPLFVGPIQALALRAGGSVGWLGRRGRAAGLAASYLPGCILLALALVRLV